VPGPIRVRVQHLFDELSMANGGRSRWDCEVSVADKEECVKGESVCLIHQRWMAEYVNEQDEQAIRDPLFMNDEAESDHSARLQMATHRLKVLKGIDVVVHPDA